jgi:hypothetical protein
MNQPIDFELTEPTPARIFGVAITIEPGARLNVYPAHDAGGQPVCRAFGRATTPFVIGAVYLREQGCEV